MSSIKKSVALVLCDKIRQENSGKWYTIAGLICWYCMKSSHGNLDKMRKVKGYGGCGLVNQQSLILTVWFPTVNLMSRASQPVVES